jgi:uncharacterized membrane protein YkvA (DUF1232 family)
MPRTYHQYEGHYSDEGFWRKLGRHARTAGLDLVERALQLYYAAQNPRTPAWAKATIYGALGYFISPIDAIPDIALGIGFTDDLAVLAVALVVVSMYVDDEARAKARQKMQQWTGE